MSLSDLASLGSFVSGFAVLVSLVFLYFQLRQMNSQGKQVEKNQQAIIRQARYTRTTNIIMSAMQGLASEESRQAWVSATSGEAESPTPGGFAQYGLYWRANFYGWEDAFYQHLDGLYSEAAFNTHEANVRNIAQNIGMRVQWRLQRQAFGPEFVAWLDKLIVETPMIGIPLTERWRDAVAAERSGAPY